MTIDKRISLQATKERKDTNIIMATNRNTERKAATNTTKNGVTKKDIKSDTCEQQIVDRQTNALW